MKLLLKQSGDAKQSNTLKPGPFASKGFQLINKHMNEVPKVDTLVSEKGLKKS